MTLLRGPFSCSSWPNRLTPALPTSLPLPLGANNDVVVSDGGSSLTVDGTVTANAGTGPWPVTDNGGSLTVDGTVTAVIGTSAGEIGKAEDAAHNTGDVGVMSLAVRNENDATFSGADGDYTPIGVDQGGRVIITGQRLHDATIGSTHRPVLTGGYASAAAPAAVSADGDMARAWYLRNGAQAVELTAAGALIPGDATNGIDVDVTRVQGTVTVDSELNLHDMDTGAGTNNQPAVGIILAASGATALVGAANPMPVSGTFTSTADTHTYGNGAIVAVNNGSTQVSLIAAGTRKGVYFQNQGTLPVYIGKTGLTSSAHILKLDPGVLVEIFENLGASSPAWFGIEHSGDVNVLAGAIT
jgi:hypothetical protein